MYELLLVGQLVQSRHDQVLKVLAGLAAMQPHRIIRRYIFYRPQREPEEPGLRMKRGGTQDVPSKNAKQVNKKDLYFSKVVQELLEGDFEAAAQSSADAPQTLRADDGTEWYWLFEDVPETANRDVLVRAAHTTDIVEGDPHAYMLEGGHRFLGEFYIEGHRVVYGDKELTLYRPVATSEGLAGQPAPSVSLPPFDSLKPYDPSGAYVLEAKITLDKLSDTALFEEAIQELKDFKEEMRGCVEMLLPDRLDYDTRVKYVPEYVPKPTGVFR
ncbi:hypothetical protein M011DRAFT_472140 [Sporormia fimetaria CBS 119925]|uniref:Mediator of RNA polymerase II transcription subunit 18 n=1 Tax=Sporormia fimetaria CBS 119925 TaxID=1340428 RepID=A0A6A6UYF8_9PLEO|nr:hypothetical protein M011DRAFT_472140 [Sporormia fimetaria CBS 119925]